MATTNFSAGTTVESSWLNDVDDVVYRKSVETPSVADPVYGAVGDGVTDDTAAIQAAITANYGKTLLFPLGDYSHGPLTITDTIALKFAPGSTIVPIFDAGSTEKLYAVTGANTTIDGLAITTVTGTISGNKYIVHADTGADNLKIINCDLSGITTSDGNTGATNLIVCHGFYIQNVSNAKILYNKVNVISGAAVFTKAVNGIEIAHNTFTDTRWYSINLDSTVVGFDIHHNFINGDNTNSRYWGGSVNLMSQTTGTKNLYGRVHHNQITGTHNYGSAIRALSCENVEITHNQIYDVITGGIGADPSMQYISLDRRGTAEGSPEGGECANIQIAYNILTAGTGGHQAIYAKNQYIATRDPHINVRISDNIIRSPSLTAYFVSAVAIHGNKAGFQNLKVEDNICAVLTASGSPVGGGLGFVSTNSTGTLTGLSIQRNSVVDIDTSAPTTTSELGIYIQATVSDGARCENNYLENFYYGLRISSSNGLIYGTENQVYVNCINNTLLQTASPGGAFNMSLGTVLPVTGVYTVGHIRQKTDAAASASWGWIVTTAGGAMTGAWASGQTYTAGTWYRNASGRVYNLITAGGGTTSVEPTATTVGGSETGADGYVWKCMSTTSARWATMPALGTVASLP